MSNWMQQSVVLFIAIASGLQGYQCWRLAKDLQRTSKWWSRFFAVLGAGSFYIGIGIFVKYLFGIDIL